MNSRIEPIKQLIGTLSQKDRAALVGELSPHPRIEGQDRPDRFLRPKEAAEYVGLSTKTLRRYEREGLIQTHRINSRVKRFKRSDLDRLLTGKGGDRNDS